MTAELQLEQVIVHTNFRYTLTTQHASPISVHFLLWFSGGLTTPAAPIFGFYLQHPQPLQGAHPADISCDINALGLTMSNRMVLKQLSRCISQCCSLGNCHLMSSWSSPGPHCSSASLQPWVSSGSEACRQPVELRLCVYSSLWPLQGVIHGFHLLLLLQYKSRCLNTYLLRPLLYCVSGSNNCQLSFFSFHFTLSIYF